MKVLHVTRGSNFASQENGRGGLERAVSELVAAQVQYGLDAEVISIGQDVLSLAGERILANQWSDLPKVVSGKWEYSNPDILHAHDWYAAPVAQYFYAKGLRSIVATAHLPVRRGFTYRDTGLSWQAKARLEHRLFDVVAKVVAPSSMVATFLSQEYGIHSDRIAIIPHGVNSVLFQPAANQARSEGDFHILAVGRITEQKGIEILIRAFATVRNALPNVTLRVIGEGDRLEACKRLVAKLDLSHVVFFEPFAGDMTLVDAYQSANLLVMPSLFEPFGLVGLEAMACGCPVLSIGPTGASYLDPDEVTPDFSPPRLANAILRRISAQPGKVKARQALRDRALNWSWTNAAAKTAKLYEQLCP
jgi:glycosyltransferase involved in cell wall biosynthesis